MPPRRSSTPNITTLEYSMTVEAKIKRQSMWIKLGATAELAEGQNPIAASKALASWVEARIQDKVEEMLA